MKTIKNIVTKIQKSDKEPTSSYADFARFALMQQPSGGFDLPTIRARNRVLNVLDKEEKSESFDLEDADFETLRIAVGQARWPWVNVEVDEFAKTLSL